MKIGRLFAFVISLLLMIAFVRTVFGAPFIGLSEILARFEQFEFDIEPFLSLIDDIRLTIESHTGTDPDFVPAEGFLDAVGYAFQSLFEAVRALAEIIILLGKTFLHLLYQTFLAVVHVFSFLLWIFGFTS